MSMFRRRRNDPVSGMDAPVDVEPPDTLDDECREAFWWITQSWHANRVVVDRYRHADRILDEWLARYGHHAGR